MERTRATVELHFADGSVITAFSSLTAHDSFTDPLTPFEFTATPPRTQADDYRQRLQKGELVSLIANGAPQGVFLIETVKRSVSLERGLSFHVECKSPLVTPYQGDVDPDLSQHSKTDAPIDTVVLQALVPYGFKVVGSDTASHRNALTGKTIDGAVSPLPLDPLKLKDAQAKENETAYKYCSRLFTRLGAVLRIDWNGELMVCAPDYQQAPSYTLVSSVTGAGPRGDVDFFVGTLEIADSNDDQFSEVHVRGETPDTLGQVQASRPVAKVPSSLLLGGHGYKSTAAPFKPKYLKDKHARDVSRCTSVAKLVHGSRAAKAFEISGEVDGWVSATGRVWTVDTVVSVFIESEQINDDFWILERTLMLDEKGGQRTRLKLLPLGALVLGDTPSG